MQTENFLAQPKWLKLWNLITNDTAESKQPNKQVGAFKR